jgi:hypothetical protein
MKFTQKLKNWRQEMSNEIFVYIVLTITIIWFFYIMFSSVKKIAEDKK